MLIVLAACSTMPQASATHLAARAAGSPQPAIDPTVCKAEGVPRIGMSADQLLKTCWGKPDTIVQDEVKGDVQYAYAGSRYVYLRNGKVESIQTNGYDDSLIP
jgi:hypothetical protein